MEVMMRDKVKDVMTTKVVYAQASAPYEELVRLLTERYVSAVPVVEAARLLHKHLVKQLPVVDPQGRLVGIISRSDLLRVFLRPDLVRAGGRPPGASGAPA